MAFSRVLPESFIPLPVELVSKISPAHPPEISFLEALVLPHVMLVNFLTVLGEILPTEEIIPGAVRGRVLEERLLKARLELEYKVRGHFLSFYRGGAISVAVFIVGIIYLTVSGLLPFVVGVSLLSVFAILLIAFLANWLKLRA